MSSAERASLRLRRWQRRIEYQYNRDQALQDYQARLLAQRQATRKPPPVNRPPHAPWGESTGIESDLDEPPF
ncbi:hypothetical protein [Kineosporia babensis]|uniref:Uncharacterized protein n=1 Tax=Kineosporia babensis TaxID=499548 RepID=A0A9X1NK29_9ACTN|nr:hypothetical protein [Kineosporia babensis]MCD5316427.1 hypothetical protein [Kineosporia babensis]